MGGLEQQYPRLFAAIAVAGHSKTVQALARFIRSCNESGFSSREFELAIGSLERFQKDLSLSETLSAICDREDEEYFSAVEQKDEVGAALHFHNARLAAALALALSPLEDQATNIQEAVYEALHSTSDPIESEEGFLEMLYGFDASAI